ncbi:MAG: hypothetical protein E7037_03070 [Verrucomicrobia bacterium]|nr:hypothetical protein [Verrucomicrobiota bacterium]
MRNPRAELLLKAKVWFLSWVLQIVFALWILGLFVLFAWVDYGSEELSQATEVHEDSSSFVLPERLIEPNPPTE